MRQKRGVIFSLIILGVLVAIAILLIGLFLFSAQLRLTFIGIALGIGFFIVGMSFKEDKFKFAFIIIGVILALALILGSGVIQSVFSVDRIGVGPDGKVKWTITATVDAEDERFNFIYNAPDFTKPDGTVVQPQKTMVLGFSKEETFCKYTLQDTTFKGVDYKVLSNAERVANIRIEDQDGNSEVIDATVVQTKTIRDVDGDGVLTVKTQGIIAGKRDCPEAENVAVVDGDLVVRTDYEDSIGRCAGLSVFDPLFYICLVSEPEIRENAQFISGFDEPPVLTANEVKGNVDVGNAIFTVTADEDYFDSVFVTPPKDVDPRIDAINIPSEIKEDSSSSMTVEISNREDSKGNIIVTAESDSLSITPSARNLILEDELTTSFRLQAIDVVTSDDVCVEVCSTNQFGDSSCDEDCESFSIVAEDEEVAEECGDGICQDSESGVTCPADCEGVVVIKTELDCGFGQTFRRTTDTVGRGPLGVGGLFGFTKEVEVEQCVIAQWVIWVIGGVIIAILSVIAFMVLRTPKKRKN